MSISRRSVWIIGLGYLALIVGIVAALLALRERTIKAIDTDASQVAWDEWRETARRQAEGSGPVTRRVPKATEPPTLMLLRDHFNSCLAMALVLGSVLYATLAFLVRGVFAGAPFQPELRSDAPPSGRR